MVKHDIAELIRQAAAAAQQQGQLPPIVLPDDLVERPSNPDFGDYASSVALKLARAARLAPLAIARMLVDHLPAAPYLAAVDVAPPGFINFRLTDRWLADQVEAVLAEGGRFGALDLGRAQRVQVEFVSANPTGPLHVGNGRGGVLGSTLANVLDFAGYRVEREYYVNDAGTQIDVFSRTLHARYLQELGREVEIPADGYPGAYMKELARGAVAAVGDTCVALPAAEARARLGELGLTKVLEWIRRDLETLGVVYDCWFRERSLFTNGQYERALAKLEESGHLARKEGALWFTATALGEDKDNVVVRSNGVPTYFASDIAYHYDKFVERGFDRVIDIWGADHQGHVPRVKAVVGALGVDPARLQVILYQLVTLRRGAEVVRISKRTGDMITLREVIEEIGQDVLARRPDPEGTPITQAKVEQVGRDACRFFFLSRSADAQMDFDLELAKQQSDENPVYYVQYAHARIASILRKADEEGVDWGSADLSLLAHPAELALIRKMLRLPELIELAATSLEPHHLAHFAQDLAGTFSVFYRDCRVLGEELALTRARLRVVAAAKQVLANTLRLMGVSAPERM